MRDLHAHTTFCDGKNTPEEMVLGAINKGVTTLGLVIHSFAPFDREVCPLEENAGAFQAEMQRLKEKYRGKINLLCGVEQDVDTPILEGFDYVIGSVHYLFANGKYYALDHTAEKLRRAVEEGFQGDPLALAEAYFKRVGQVYDLTGADVLAHLDLITKFNEKDPLFDTSHPRYVNAVKGAIEKLLPTGIAFEVNTGAITRGYRTSPYPETRWAAYLKKRGAKLMINSDAHDARGIANGFPAWEALTK